MNWVLGFDIGGTKCAAVLGRTDGKTIEIVEKRKYATTDFPVPADCITHFGDLAEDLMKQHMVSAVMGIGISCGGPLDDKHGVVMSPPNLPGWDHIPVSAMLTERFGIPAGLCNDADACAVAEWRYGAGRGTRNMIFLTFGTGLGAGLILNGQLYSGSCGMAGECGHFRLEPDGPVGYGKAGSFEGFCSGGGIAQMGRRYAAEHPNVVWKENPTAKTIGDAAKAGDPDALAVYRESARHLGRGLALLVDLLNPERIVIGSIFARSESLFRAEMEAELNREALRPNAAVCRIVPAELGDSIGDYACLAVAMKKQDAF